MNVDEIFPELEDAPDEDPVKTSPIPAPRAPEFSSEGSPPVLLLIPSPQWERARLRERLAVWIAVGLAGGLLALGLVLLGVLILLARLVALLVTG